MQALYLYGPRKSKPKKSELRKQQYTVTRFDCSHLAQVLILLQVQKFVCYSTVFDLCHFEFEYNFRVQAPRGLYLEGRFIGGVAFRVWGPYTWRGLFSEFYDI